MIMYMRPLEQWCVAVGLIWDYLVAWAACMSLHESNYQVNYMHVKVDCQVDYQALTM